MKKVNGHKNKNTSRPKKTGTKLRQRLASHRKRLVELGVSEKEASTMTRKEMLALLKAPKKTAAKYSA